MYQFNQTYERANQNIVLDIDGTLLHTLFYPERDAFLSEMDNVLLGDTFSTVHLNVEWSRITTFRPYLQKFLAYCQFRFNKKIIWSAGGLINVQLMTSAMTSNSPIKFDTMLSSDDTPVTAAQSCGAKDLYKLYTLFPEMNASNTLILDDNESTFAGDINNGITIPQFNNEKPSELSTDDSLLVLMEWFDRPSVVNTRDVRLLDKRHIFI